VVSRWLAAFERLNPALPPEAITTAVDELRRDRSAMGREAVLRTGGMMDDGRGGESIAARDARNRRIHETGPGEIPPQIGL